MGKIDRFEDLIAWQKAPELTKAIYRVTPQGAFAKDFGLSSQIQRAVVLVMSNIAQGFERSRRTEFHQFLLPELFVLKYVANSTFLLILVTSTRLPLKLYYDKPKRSHGSSAYGFPSKNKEMLESDGRRHSTLNA